MGSNIFSVGSVHAFSLYFFVVQQVLDDGVIDVKYNNFLTVILMSKNNNLSINKTFCDLFSIDNISCFDR